MTPFDAVISLIGIVFGLLATAWLTARFDLRKENFQGRRIPSVGGLFFVLSAVFVYGVQWALWHFEFGAVFAYLLAVAGFGVLGFWDDVRGDRSVGGFRGHLGQLAGGRVTTGAVKLIGGGLLSLIIGYALWHPDRLAVAIAALLVALSANTLNLLDLRPGRCLTAFLAGAALLFTALVLLHQVFVGFFLGFAVVAALALYAADSRGRAMIGDTGSNAFGAVLGVATALYLPLLAQTIVLALLALVNFWCETHSLSETIEKNALLRRIDRKIGIR